MDEAAMAARGQRPLILDLRASGRLGGAVWALAHLQPQPLCSQLVIPQEGGCKLKFQGLTLSISSKSEKLKLDTSMELVGHFGCLSYKTSKDND